MTEPKSNQPMSWEEFDQRLLDGDRWIEVVNGRFTRLEPPDDAHGDVVRNLAQALAMYFKKSKDTYACFELPLILERKPATVRSPAISCFRIELERGFVEMDKSSTDTRPLLVIEVASTNDRREAMSDRVRSYLDGGVKGVWVIDPVTRHVHQFHNQLSGRMLKETETLVGQPLLEGFSIPVSELFRQPSWLPK